MVACFLDVAYFSFIFFNESDSKSISKFGIPNARNFVFVIFPDKYLEEIFEMLGKYFIVCTPCCARGRESSPG